MVPDPDIPSSVIRHPPSAIRQPSGLHPGPDDWLLTPEGAVIQPAEQTAILADVHLGYEWARASGGDMVPAHSLTETLGKLSSLLQRAEIRRLVVAGDLTESPRHCPRTRNDLKGLSAWLLDRNVELVWLRGNHDPSIGLSLPMTLNVAGWTIGHGHQSIQARKAIFGHYHPAVRVDRRSFPCFLFTATRIALPAFSPNAAGLDLARATLPVGWSNLPWRCLVSSGEELLDLGPLADLRIKLSGGSY